MLDAPFSFAHFNVRSVCTGFDLLSELILKEQFTIVGLSETWLDSGVDSNNFAIDGYKLLRKDRVGRGGGVAFYIHNSIKFKIIDITGDNFLEEIWISVKVNGRSLCLGSLYRPPNVNLNQSVDRLESALVNNIHSLILFYLVETLMSIGWIRGDIILIF